MNAAPEKFGDLIRRHRADVGLTQEQLAESARMSVRAISDLERGARLHPRSDTIHFLAEALRLSPEDRVAFKKAAHHLQDPPHQSVAEPASQATRTIATNQDGVPPLPAMLTSFVGREQQIADVRRQLATTRLLTLIGTGGVGKTRLAVQVATDLGELFPDGTCLVELGAIADPALVVGTVAMAFKLREGPDEPILSTVIRYLAPRTTLLVLDSCEHLIDACARVAAELLRTCSRLTILATSREALRIGGEVAWRVPSLSVPPPGRYLASGPGSVAHLSQFEAPYLFIERARAVEPSFNVTERNVPAVAEICRRLDGIPLAIELAAARVKLLSAEQIVVRLGDRFRLLSGGSRAALPRYQTLRAAIEWSYNLLSEAERRLLGRLSVFAGGWTIEAAESVCDDPDESNPDSAVGPRAGPPSTSTTDQRIFSEDVLDLLSQLIDKSLVQVEQRDGVERYQMLETIGKFAQDRLVEAGEATRTRIRHRDWFASLAERAEPRLFEYDQREWLDLLEVEHDNLRAALSYCRESDPRSGLRLAGALGRFWNRRGYLTEGRRWIEEMLRRVPADEDPRLEAKAILTLGIFDVYENPARSKQQLEESLRRYREIGDESGMGWALRSLGLLARAERDGERSRQLYDESLAHFQSAGDPTGLRWTLGFRGSVEHWLGGDYRLARKLYDKALELQRASEDTSGIGQALYHLGLLDSAEGDVDRARERLEEGLEKYLAAGERVFVGRIYSRLENLARSQGDYDQALHRFREGLAIARETGSIAQIATLLSFLGMVAIDLGALDRGVRLHAAAGAIHRYFTGMLIPEEIAAREASLATARGELGSDAFELAWAEGVVMDLDTAIVYAMGIAQLPLGLNPPTSGANPTKRR